MKKIILCVVLAICAVGANAQEMSPEEVAKLKKEMNDIKKSEDFVFAEGFAEYLSEHICAVCTKFHLLRALHLTESSLPHFSNSVNSI